MACGLHLILEQVPFCDAACPARGRAAPARSPRRRRRPTARARRVAVVLQRRVAIFAAPLELAVV
eukprot:8993426-Pyramimonas_sp.AAC.1